MQVINYIKEHGIEHLQEELGIKVKEYPDYDIVVLNYCQIESPKTHPVVRECRGLILDTKDWSVVCRPFDRFFNAGEAPETVEDFDITRACAFEKVDGSLIKIYKLGNQWECATRGTAFAESSCNGFDITFRELVFKALGVYDGQEFSDLCSLWLQDGYTYLFELTSTENRVVTRYEGTKLWYLGARHNETGTDRTDSPYHDACAKGIGAESIQRFLFDTLEHALEASKGLPDLQEGYVLFDTVTHKRIKVKSPAYVAVHHIRGEGLNPKRIKELVLTNEQDEYLKYFPEDAPHIEPVVFYLSRMELEMHNLNMAVRGIEDQKAFALEVKDEPYSNVLFQARKKGLTTQQVFATMDSNQKFKTFSKYLEGKYDTDQLG